MKYKIMKASVFVFILSLFLNSCKKPCHEDLRIGERLEIPLQFEGFSDKEINQVLVYRIDLDPSVKTDTFSFSSFTPFYPVKEGFVNVSDRTMNNNKYGYYESYLNDCHLVFDWYSGTDTLKNIEIKKSQEKVKDPCYKSHPNVQIDFVKIEHKEKNYYKSETIVIEK